MLHTFARDVTPESILFHDRLKTAFAPSGVLFRPLTAADETELRSLELDAQAGWGLEVEGLLAAAGGILFHYNPPYGDIYMKVAEPFRRRGLGVYLVQELKRVCRERGNVPAARCRADNVASRKTLQKAGFVPCGHILTGTVTV
jgi:GNAT superfamily N-acetyltransferase